MEEITPVVRRWTPSDYAPTYEFEVDAAGNFVRHLHVWSAPPEYHEENPAAYPRPDDLIGPAHYEAYVRASEAKWKPLPPTL